MWSRTAFLEADPSLPELPAIGHSRQTAAVGNILGAHEHPGAFEIVLINRGRLNWWVEDERITLSAGSLFCTRPGETHGAVDQILEPSEILWAQFRLDLDNAFGLNSTDREEVASALGQAERTGQATELLHRHLMRILHEKQSASPRNWMIRSHAVCFLSEVIEALAKPYAEVPDPRIKRAVDLLRTDIGQRISIASLAASVGLSKSRFHYLFRVATGLSANEWLQRERTEQAKILLGRSDSSITEIAHKLGYSSSQYFATSFKKQTGLSPAEWRKAANRRRIGEENEHPRPDPGVFPTGVGIRPTNYGGWTGLTRWRRR